MAKVIEIYDAKKSEVHEHLTELHSKIMENYRRKMKDAIKHKRASSKLALTNSFN